MLVETNAKLNSFNGINQIVSGRIKLEIENQLLIPLVQIRINGKILQVLIGSTSLKCAVKEFKMTGANALHNPIL